MRNLDLDPVSVTIWILVIASCFIFMVARLASSIAHILTYRHGLSARAQSLRFGQMLGRLGIGLPRYLRTTGDIELECRLFTCKQCPSTEKCQHYLDGQKDLDPATFCPNFPTFVARWGTLGRRP